jgi:hypothetical protein
MATSSLWYCAFLLFCTRPLLTIVDVKEHRQIGGFLISDLSSGFVLNPDIYTTARDLSVKGLQELAAKYPKTRLALIELNVTDVASIKKASEEVATLLPNGLDYLFNNADP